VDTGLASDLEVSKLAPAAVAEALLRAMARDRYEVLVGQAGAVAFANRLSGGLAETLVARATRSA
jgi:hypothetical protein